MNQTLQKPLQLINPLRQLRAQAPVLVRQVQARHPAVQAPDHKRQKFSNYPSLYRDYQESCGDLTQVLRKHVCAAQKRPRTTTWARPNR
jgi:hypothetical protein